MRGGEGRCEVEGGLGKLEKNCSNLADICGLCAVHIRPGFTGNSLAGLIVTLSFIG
jgi:hypothetical protein